MRKDINYKPYRPEESDSGLKLAAKIWLYTVIFCGLLSVAIAYPEAVFAIVTLVALVVVFRK